MLFELIGHRNLHRAIEGQLAVLHAPQHLHRRLHHIIAFQHLVPEAGAGKLDLLGQRHLLLPGQQGNLAHLRQVHPHGIVGPRFVFLDARHQVVGADVQFWVVLFVVLQDRSVQVVLDIQRLDWILHQIQRFFRPGDRFILQAVQQCVVQSAAPQVSPSRVVSVYEPAQELNYPMDSGQKPKNSPPNFSAAALLGHLARDSACGENSFARSKNPNRSRIPKAVHGATAAKRPSRHRPIEAGPQHTDRASIFQVGNRDGPVFHFFGDETDPLRPQAI